MFSFAPPGLEEFYRTFSITYFSISHDEQQIAFSTNMNGHFNIWGMDLPNTFPYPLTMVNQRPSFVRFDPKGRFLLAGFDRDGDENQQIYAISPNGGQLMPIRVQHGKRHDFSDITQDGRYLYYSSDKDNAMYLNSYRYDLETEEETIIYEGKEVTTALLTVAPNGSSFVIAKASSNTHVACYLLIDDEEICLTPDDQVPHVVDFVRYLDDDQLVFTTNYQASHSYLVHYDIPTRAMTRLIQLENRDITWITVNQQGMIYFVAQNGVEDELFLYDLPTHAYRKIDFPGAVIHQISVRESGNLYVLCSSEDHPVNLYRRTIDGVWTQLTNLRVIGASPTMMQKAKTIHYPSFDGMIIEAMLFQPAKEKSNDHTIIFPHGGPQAADRKNFWSLTQFLLSQGYAIFSPNYRGSTGYGAEFTKMIERDWGGAPRQDVVSGIDYLIEQGLAHREKLFVMGGSYGGYMTLLLHGRHAEYFRAAVDIFGPSDLFTFYHSVPEFWKPMMDAWLGNPESDKEKMTEDSPITYLDAMTKPMLVIQGANDPRVVKAESDQIVERLRKKGRDIEYLVLEDEGHGFSKKENELRVYQRVIEFLDKHQWKEGK
nr:S9 family peptidase [Bacilli bacterium]